MPADLEKPAGLEKPEDLGMPADVDMEVPSVPLPAAQPALSPQEAIAACDRLAASPNDVNRVAEGVWQTIMDADAAILVCTQGVAAAPDNARLRFQLGRALYRTGKKPEAALAFGKAATLGHLPAQAQLGLMLVAGDGHRARRCPRLRAGAGGRRQGRPGSRSPCLAN